MKRMLTIAIIADMHSSTGHIMEEGEYLIRLFGHWIIKWILKSFKRTMRESIKDHKHVEKTLKQMQDNGPYDAVIGLGDYSQTGEYHESNEAIGLLEKYFPNTPMYLIPGNHDTQSWIKFQDRWAENMDEDQLNQVRQLFGPLFEVNPLGEHVLLIQLMSEPFIFDWHRHKYLSENQKELLTRLRRQQIKLLDETFSDPANAEKKIVIAVHDPGVLLSEHMQEVLRPHKSRILVILTGHIHARWLMNLMIVWHPILWPKLLLLMREFKARLIPSVWGIVLPSFLHKAGAGWAELEIGDEDKLIIRYSDSPKFNGEKL